MKSLKVVIVGGGIGGKLCGGRFHCPIAFQCCAFARSSNEPSRPIIGFETALALAADSHEILLLEAANDFAEVRSKTTFPALLRRATQQGKRFPIRHAWHLCSYTGRRRYTHTAQWSRLSLRWGVDFEPVKKQMSNGNRFLDWKDGRTILDVPSGNVQALYGAPYYFVHRADFIQALLIASRTKPNLTVKTGARVVEYDFDTPRVRTQD